MAFRFVSNPLRFKVASLQTSFLLPHLRVAFNVDPCHVASTLLINVHEIGLSLFDNLLDRSRLLNDRIIVPFDLVDIGPDDVLVVCLGFAEIKDFKVTLFSLIGARVVINLTLGVFYVHRSNVVILFLFLYELFEGLYTILLFVPLIQQFLVNFALG